MGKQPIQHTPLSGVQEGHVHSRWNRAIDVSGNPATQLFQTPSHTGHGVANADYFKLRRSKLATHVATPAVSDSY